MEQHSMNTKPISTLWKAIIAIALAGIQAKAAETLTVEYTLKGIEGIRHELQVEKDIEQLEFRESNLTSFTIPEGLTELKYFTVRSASLTNLSLPDGLTKLWSLNVYGGGLTNLSLPDGLVSLRRLELSYNPFTSLKLPEDFGKNVESEIHLNKYDSPSPPLEQLSVHYKMKQFGIIRARGQYGRLSFPPAKELIKNRTPDSDGVFRIQSSPATIAGNKVGFDSEGVFRMELRTPLLLEVYGLEPTLTITRKASGVEAGWESGTLQRSLLIDGPWQDVESGRTDRRLFLRPSHPYEFFRVKPTDDSE